VYTSVNSLKTLLQPRKTIVQLEYPDIVLNPLTNNRIGRWSMVYDEGFEIFLQDMQDTHSDYPL
jgi:hypothetical protein